MNAAIKSAQSVQQSFNTTLNTSGCIAQNSRKRSRPYDSFSSLTETYRPTKIMKLDEDQIYVFDDSTEDYDMDDSMSSISDWDYEMDEEFSESDPMEVE